MIPPCLRRSLARPAAGGNDPPRTPVGHGRDSSLAPAVWSAPWARVVVGWKSGPEGNHRGARVDERAAIEGSDLDSLRNDLRASLRRVKATRRDLAGTPHEIRLEIMTEALDRCVRDLTYLLLAAGSPVGLYGGQGVTQHESHGQRRNRH